MDEASKIQLLYKLDEGWEKERQGSFGDVRAPQMRLILSRRRRWWHRSAKSVRTPSSIT